MNANIDASADIAQSKMADVTNMRVLGNTSGSSTTPQEVTIYDEDNMSSNSNTGIATQQSIKAYVTSLVGGATTELDNLGTTSINADLDPSDTSGNRDLGNSSNQWGDLWVTGVAYLDAIGFGTTAMTLPTSDGSANYVLKTDGNGNLDWASVSGASTSFVGFSADNDLTMNTYNIDGLDQLIFSTATSTTSPTWNDSNIGMEASSVGLYFNVPSNDYFTFNIDGDTEFSISASTISASSKRITYVTDPSGAQDAATPKNYVDNNSGSGANTSLSNLNSTGESHFVKLDNTGSWTAIQRFNAGIDMQGEEIDDCGDINFENNNADINFNSSGYIKTSGTTHFYFSSQIYVYRDLDMQSHNAIQIRNGDINFSGTGLPDWRASNYTTTNVSTPSTASGKIKVRVNGSTKYVYYYDS